MHRTRLVEWGFRRCPIWMSLGNCTLLASVAAGPFPAISTDSATYTSIFVAEASPSTSRDMKRGFWLNPPFLIPPCRCGVPEQFPDPVFHERSEKEGDAHKRVDLKEGLVDP